MPLLISIFWLTNYIFWNEIDSHVSSVESDDISGLNVKLLLKIALYATLI